MSNNLKLYIMEIIKSILIYVIVPMVGAFIGTVVFGILKDKLEK